MVFHLNIIGMLMRRVVKWEEGEKKLEQNTSFLEITRTVIESTVIA